MFSYIGICDFPSGEQSLKSAKLFDELSAVSKARSRKLMIGVMMSFKTMTGLPSKWASVWPKKENVAEIFIDHPSVFNTLHYADYDDVTTLPDLLQAAFYSGTHLHALQLDMVWPAPQMIIDFRQVKPDTKMVLQLNTNALQMTNNDPSLVVDNLREYGDSVEYALLDKSHGKGFGMDAEALLPFVRAIAEKLPNIGLVAAGGLGPDTMGLVEPLVREFPDISIDAQGKLRPSGNAMDPIDWVMADSYLAQAVQMFS